ncbi:MAG: thioredoxin family protein [Syntrophobacteraceae bacterium]|nr:thioredoxin family protein [Syntrophobacteraceae bacterium]
MNRNNIIATCSKCGTRNRIPINRMRENAVCGRCRNPLSIDEWYPEHPVDVTDRTFRNEVLNFPGSTVVYFWAPWCGHCQRLNPVMDELAGKYAGRLKIARLALEENPAVSSQLNVRSVPTLLFMKGGKQVNRLDGALPREQLEYYFRALLQGGP